MASYKAALANTPIVIDNGSGVIKAGMAGQDTPSCFFPSCVGRTKYDRVMAGGAVEGDVFVGRKTMDFRGMLKLKYPIEHGIVTDWDDMERIWGYLFSEELGVNAEDHPILLTEAPLNPRKNREQAAEILFEQFNVPALFVSIQAVLALYASGRTTGLVLDSGDGVTHTVPVFEGFAARSAIQRVDLAGRDVTRNLQFLLRKSGYALDTSAEFEITRIIKETKCYLSLNQGKEDKEMLGKYEEYLLPDGRVMQLGAERFQAPEVLFQPELVGLEYRGIHQLVTDSILRADTDLRQQLYSNIVLSGGTTLTRGFGDRLLLEMKKLALRNVKVKIYAPPERKYSTWIGGKNMWVTNEEYQEDPEILHRKMF